MKIENIREIKTRASAARSAIARGKKEGFVDLAGL
jgi:hypothetical protein